MPPPTDDDSVGSAGFSTIRSFPAAPASRRAPPVAAPPSDPGPRPVPTHLKAGARCVLLIEEDASTRDIVARGLGTEYTVYEVEDGATALRILPQLPALQAIVCDATMRRTDRHSFEEVLRADAKTREIPLLLLTARDFPFESRDGAHSGSCYYLMKPFELRSLLEQLASFDWET